MVELETFDVIIVAVRGTTDSSGGTGGDRFAYPGDLEDHVERVESIFRSLGAAKIDRVDPTEASDIHRWLQGWSTKAEPRSTLVYWLGHGEVSDHKHYLITTDSSLPLFSQNTVTAASIAEYLRHNADKRDDSGRARFAALLLDCCQAGFAVNEIFNDLSIGNGVPNDLGLFGATDVGGTSYGRTPSALEEVVTNKFDVNSEITLGKLLRELKDHLGSATLREDRLHASKFVLRGPIFDGVVSGTQDTVARVVDVLSKLEPEVRAHFLQKAQGAESDEFAWYFVGRTDETVRVNDWLRASPGGMFVVTGSAGAGKSAFLGRLVTFSNRELVNVLADEKWFDLSPNEAELPPANCFDAVIHLTGKSLADATARVAERLDGFDGNASNPEEVVTFLAHAGYEQFTLLVDALDEAAQPIQIASSLLRRLAAIRGVRVVVGTRRSLNEDPDHPVADDQFLLDALAIRARRDSVLSLADDPIAQRDYVIARLHRGAGYTIEDATEIADRVVRRSEPFLFARLAAIEIAARRLAPDAAELGHGGILDAHHQGLFAAALTRLDSIDPHIVPILRAAAYSFGRGFPIVGRVWITAAKALHPHLDLTSEHITLARREAGPYITVDGEHGDTVYRLAHRTYAEYFHLETDP